MLPSLIRWEEVAPEGPATPQATALALLRCRSVPAVGGLPESSVRPGPSLGDLRHRVCLSFTHSFIVIGEQFLRGRSPLLTS